MEYDLYIQKGFVVEMVRKWVLGVLMNICLYPSNEVHMSIILISVLSIFTFTCTATIKGMSAQKILRKHFKLCKILSVQQWFSPFPLDRDASQNFFEETL